MAWFPGTSNGFATVEAMTPEASYQNGAFHGTAPPSGGAADSGERTEGKRRRKPMSRSSGEAKGLRHFSLKICEKVKIKGRTTYNEVADELVAEITGPEQHLLPQDQQYDEKNIRRRVYDALNVLMALDIISKERKEIQWKGLLPSSLDEAYREKATLEARVEQKQQIHQDLQEQVAAIERLIQRNEVNFANGGDPPGTGVGLPFILVQTRPQATVDVEISPDMQLVHFDFGSTPFALHDDGFVLRAMGLGNTPLDHSVLAPTASVRSAGGGAAGSGAGTGAVPGQQRGGGYATAVPGPGRQAGYATGALGSGQVHQGMALGLGAGGGGGGASEAVAQSQDRATAAAVSGSGVPGQGMVYQQAARAQPGAPYAQQYGGSPAPFSGARYGPADGGRFDGAGQQGQDQFAKGDACAANQHPQVQLAQHMYSRMPMYQQADPQGAAPAMRAGCFPNQLPVGSYQPGAVLYQVAPGPAQ